MSEASANMAVQKYNGVAFDGCVMNINFLPDMPAAAVAPNMPHNLPADFANQIARVVAQKIGVGSGVFGPSRIQPGRGGFVTKPPRKRFNAEQKPKTYGEYRKAVPSQEQLDAELDKMEQARKKSALAKIEKNFAEDKKAQLRKDDLDVEMDEHMKEMTLEAANREVTPTPSLDGEEGEDEDEDKLFMADE